MADLVSALRDEIRRLARKEIRSEIQTLKKQSAQFRRDIAAMKRENAVLVRTVAAVRKSFKSKSGNAAPAVPGVPVGTRFSARSLRSQRLRAGLSQADYASLVGVSTLTMNQWENKKTRPSPKHIATIVSLRGLGKKEAQRQLEEL